jgi:TrmH family RNA methyltransferase
MVEGHSSLPELGLDRQKRIAALHHAKYRRRYGLSFTEGVRSVCTAVAARAPIVEIVIAQSAVSHVSKELDLEKLPAFVVPDAVLARLSDVDSHQGVMATFRTPSLSLFEDVHRLRRVVILDGVQDPGNVGTIIRTAAWYGVDGVIAGTSTADYFSPKTIRSTMGAVWSVRLYRVADLPGAITVLGSAGFTICAAAAHGDEVQTAVQKLGVVLGSEAHGVSEAILGLVDWTTAVPPAAGAHHAGVDSLNVAVAGGIVMDRLFGRG